jgi:ribosomal protein S18 acetylase RimI-like enzyme
MKTVLDNIMWHALTGAHAVFASGAGGARRYARGFSPIVGFEDLQHPDFDALTPHCAPGEQFYCSDWSGEPPASWQVELESTMCLMVWNGGTSGTEEMPEAVRLGPQHAARAMELAGLTRPGPFGPRTIELGDYFGVFEGERLIAMAGERLHAGVFRELSGVCAHPDFQGRGLARRLSSMVVRRQLDRGQTPILHVMSSNTGARQLYQRLGFADYKEPVVRVISLR